MSGCYIIRSNLHAAQLVLIIGKSAGALCLIMSFH